MLHVECEVFDIIQMEDEHKNEVSKDTSLLLIRIRNRLTLCILAQTLPMAIKLILLLLINTKHSTINQANNKLGHFGISGLQEVLLDKFPISHLFDEPMAVSGIVVQVCFEAVKGFWEELGLVLVPLKDREVEDCLKLEDFM